MPWFRVQLKQLIEKVREGGVCVSSLVLVPCAGGGCVC